MQENTRHHKFITGRIRQAVALVRPDGPGGLWHWRYRNSAETHDFPASVAADADEFIEFLRTRTMLLPDSLLPAPQLIIQSPSVFPPEVLEDLKETFKRKAAAGPSVRSDPGDPGAHIPAEDDEDPGELGVEFRDPDGYVSRNFLDRDAFWRWLTGGRGY